MFKIARGADKPTMVTMAKLAKLAKAPADAVETAMTLRLEANEEELYQWFTILLKARFHMSPFFQLAKPASFFPGTVKFNPPEPFKITEVEGGFDVTVTAILDYRRLYVLMVVLENALTWVKSEHGAARLGTKRKIKRSTFENLFLRGQPIPLVERHVAVAAGGGTIRVTDEAIDAAAEAAADEDDPIGA